MARGGQAAHVGANFRDDHPGLKVADPGDRAQQSDRIADGSKFGVDLAVDLLDGGVDLPRLERE